MSEETRGSLPLRPRLPYDGFNSPILFFRRGTYPLLHTLCSLCRIPCYFAWLLILSITTEDLSLRMLFYPENFSAVSETFLSPFFLLEPRAFHFCIVFSFEYYCTTLSSEKLPPLLCREKMDNKKTSWFSLWDPNKPSLPPIAPFCLRTPHSLPL